MTWTIEDLPQLSKTNQVISLKRSSPKTVKLLAFTLNIV